MGDPRQAREKHMVSLFSGSHTGWVVGVALWLASGGLVVAQDDVPAADVTVGQAMHLSVVQDWSNRHILFTNGGRPETVAASQRDPRSLNNWLSRNAGLLGLGRIPQEPREESTPADDQRMPRGPVRPVLGTVGKTRNRNSKIDWAMSLGPTGGMPLAEAPAKYTFDINATPSCANDFVVYTITLNETLVAGAGKQANLIAFNNLYSGTGTSLCNRTTPTVMWSYAVGTGGSDLSPSLSLDGKKVVFIEELSRFASAAESASPESRCLWGDIYISSGRNVWIDKPNS